VASTKTERGSQKGSKEPSPGEGKNNQAASQAGKPTPGASNTPQSGNEASTQQSSTQKSNSENTYHIVKNPIEFRIIEDVVKLAYTPHKEGGYNVMNEFFSFITKDASTFTREQLHDYIVKRSTEKNIVEKDESKGRVVYEYSSKELSNISPDSYLLQNFNSNFKFKLVAKEEEENFGYGVEREGSSVLIMENNDGSRVYGYGFYWADITSLKLAEERGSVIVNSEESKKEIEKPLTTGIRGVFLVPVKLRPPEGAPIKINVLIIEDGSGTWVIHPERVEKDGKLSDRLVKSRARVYFSDTIAPSGYEESTDPKKEEYQTNYLEIVTFPFRFNGDREAKGFKEKCSGRMCPSHVNAYRFDYDEEGKIKLVYLGTWDITLKDPASNKKPNGE
jgi:hypothetical protein